MKDIKDYISQMNQINLLIKYNKVRDDALSSLYEELLNIIFYGNFNELISYSKKVYDIDIHVDPDDNLGFRIKSFILLYLNDVIAKSLNN